MRASPSPEMQIAAAVSGWACRNRPVAALRSTSSISAAPPARERRPHALELEADVPGRVHAVVDEELDPAQPGDEPAQHPPARAAEQGPAVAEALRHRGAGLVREALLQQRGEVDAPQPAAAVASERLEQDAGGEAARDAGLDDTLGAQVPRQAPREAAQADVGVVPPAEGAATHPQPAGGEVARGGSQTRSNPSCSSHGHEAASRSWTRSSHGSVGWYGQGGRRRSSRSASRSNVRSTPS